MKRVQVRKTVERRAFTLLEVLMVIVILGVLAALIVPQFTGTQEQSKIKTTRIQVRSIEDALERFKMECGRYPTSEEGLAALVSKPGSEDIADKWPGAYLKQPARDAWDRELQYRFPGQYNSDSFDVWSNGPDGNEGSEDDITNWKKAS
jgi:general secretion pathway protein G